MMAAAAHFSSSRRVLQADRIFDGESVRYGEAVVIDGDTIAAVIPAQALPPGLPILTFPGCTLLPGLIDMHVHFMRWEGPLFLAYGVTTVRDVGNNLDWILARRGEWNAQPWPRIYTFGCILDGPDPLHGDCARACRDAASARAAVVEVAAAGVDGIKLYVGIQPEWLPGMVKEAHSAGLHVAMHCGVATALTAAAAGVNECFHLDGLLADFWADNPGGWLSAWGLPGCAERFDRQKEIADRISESRITATPTLAWWDTNWRRLAPGYPGDDDIADIPADIVAWQCADCRPDPATSELWRRALEAAQRFVGLLLERDVPVFAGTDVFCNMLRPGQSLWHELALLTECGMSPIDALRTATSRAAACLGNGRLGRIAPGCSADLVAVRGDPTREIPAHPNVVTVARAGKVFNPADLQDMASWSESAAAADPWRTEFAKATKP